MVFRINTDPDRSAARITELYRSLTVALVSVDSISSSRVAAHVRAQQLAMRIRELCVELERLLAVADEGDEPGKSLLPRRIGVVEREIQMLIGNVQALRARQFDRVELEW